MINEQDIKREARLVAIEHLLAHQFALTTLQLSDAQFEQMGQNWQTTFDRETFEGIDAALSDLLSAEIRDAMMSLLQQVRDRRQDMKKLVS